MARLVAAGRIVIPANPKRPHRLCAIGEGCTVKVNVNVGTSGTRCDYALEEKKAQAALDNGADDYVTKPFSSGELLARLRVAQRHAAPTSESTVFRSGHLEVDLAARIVKRKGVEVKLTATEYSLLRFFVQHAGKVLTHRQILREVWGPNYVEQTHYLRVYLAHLREKLEADPGRPELFITESGIGYRLLEIQNPEN